MTSVESAPTSASTSASTPVPTPATPELPKPIPKEDLDKKPAGAEYTPYEALYGLGKANILSEYNLSIGYPVDKNGTAYYPVIVGGPIDTSEGGMESQDDTRYYVNIKTCEISLEQDGKWQSYADYITAYNKQDEINKASSDATKAKDAAAVDAGNALRGQLELSGVNVTGSNGNNTVFMCNGTITNYSKSKVTVDIKVTVYGTSNTIVNPSGSTSATVNPGGTSKFSAIVSLGKPGYNDIKASITSVKVIN